MLHKLERVLLVDADATVGRFAQDVLSLMGYEVVVTTRGQEAGGRTREWRVRNLRLRGRL